MHLPLLLLCHNMAGYGAYLFGNFYVIMQNEVFLHVSLLLRLTFNLHRGAGCLFTASVLINESLCGTVKIVHCN